MIRVDFDEARSRLETIYRSLGVPAEGAALLGRILATNSLEGVPSHGIHFHRSLAAKLRQGDVVPAAQAGCAATFGAWEQWDGHQAPGPLSALAASQRATAIAREHGTGVVALRNTNHWARPGYYAREAANAGFAMICWANTPFVMPPWGSKRLRIGNNPIVFALPHGDCPLVLDMALSQYSIGQLGTTKLLGRLLDFDGGYDNEGHLSRDPGAILESHRSLPIGLWKGSGMALLLDLMGSALSGGNTTLQRTQREGDSVSQVFIAFDLSRVDRDALAQRVQATLDDLRETWEPDGDTSFRFPGEGAAARREHNREAGVPVDEDQWAQIVGESSG